MELKSDIRGLLQYVPLFRCKVFVVDVDWMTASDAAKAEVMMDLVALQSVGVKLVVSMQENQATEFFDFAAELELRVSVSVRSLDDENVAALLERGQAFVISRNEVLLSDALINLSVSLGAAKMICLTTGPELLDSSGGVVKFIHISDYKQRIVDSTEAAFIQQQASKACQAGVPRVHLLDIQKQGVLINELFSSEGVGTMFYRDSYREIRPVTEEDISEMLGMIGRSVRNTHLVPRTFEEVRDRISEYYVTEVDDNVVGCGALYEYRKCAEIACLYVKQSHEGTGYGAAMVEFLENTARSKKIEKVFALSNRASDFFKNIGYDEMHIEDLPKSRYAKLKESGRESQAFVKRLI